MNIYIYTHTHTHTYHIVCVSVYIYIYTHTIEYYSAIKRMKSCHLSSMNKPRDYYTK